MSGNSTIRLFADAHVFDGEYQGSRTFIKELYNELIKNKNIQLYLAAYDIDNLKLFFPEVENLYFIKYKTRNRVVRLAIEIPQLVKKYGIGYAHFQYIAPLYKNCKFIVTTHDVLFNNIPSSFSTRYRWQKNFLYRLGAKKADILTTVSAYSKQAVNRYFKIDTGRIHVIPHGVNPKFFEPYDKKQSVDFIRTTYGLQKIILYVSRFEPRKNHAALLQAFIDLALYEQDYHLVLAGHKSIPVTAFDQLLDSLPETVRRYIFISNTINDDELLQLYRAATVFVYPSLGEGFGMPPLEAGALKIPVLCSNTTALADFSFFGSNHADLSGYETLKNKLAGILNTPPGDLQLTEIQNIIKNNYCWTKTAAQFYALLQQNNTV